MNRRKEAVRLKGVPAEARFRSAEPKSGGFWQIVGFNNCHFREK